MTLKFSVFPLGGVLAVGVPLTVPIKISYVVTSPVAASQLIVPEFEVMLVTHRTLGASQGGGAAAVVKLPPATHADLKEPQLERTQ